MYVYASRFFRIDVLKNYHLCHSALHMQNPSSLPDHGIEFKTLIKQSAYPDFGAFASVAMIWYICTVYKSCVTCTLCIVFLHILSPFHALY